MNPAFKIHGFLRSFSKSEEIVRSLKWYYTITKFLLLQVLKILRLSFSGESIGINVICDISHLIH